MWEACKDGVVGKALASHQCDSGLIIRPSVICASRLWLFLIIASRVFSGFSGFPPSTKSNTSKFQFDQWGMRGSRVPPLQDCKVQRLLPRLLSPCKTMLI